MAEGGAKNIGKVLQKTVTRTKEKVLQNLGKADRTKDDQFEQHEATFNEQLITAHKLQKVLKAYTDRLKDMSLASAALYRAVKEAYSDDWVGYTDFCAAHEDVVGSWDVYSSHISETAVAPLNNFIAIFPKFKEKIAKRKRKLTDYDSARHNYDSIYNSKKMDESKINKAQEELNEAKQIYETINLKMMEELSSFHKSRIHVMSSVFHNIIGAEMKFHSNSTKVKKAMSHAVEKLMQDAEKFPASSHDVFDTPQGSQSTDDDHRYVDLDFKLTHQALVPNRTPRGSLRNQSASNEAEMPTTGLSTSHILASLSNHGVEEETVVHRDDSSPRQAPKRSGAPLPAVPAPTYQSITTQKRVSKPQEVDAPKAAVDGTQKIPEEAKSPEERTDVVSSAPMESAALNGDSVEREVDLGDAPPSTAVVVGVRRVESNDPPPESKKEDSNAGQTYENHGVVPTNRILFRVKATHSYIGEDMDELTFEAGEVITVVPFDDPDEQDEGWLMGVKESTRERGVFPENFTVRSE